MGAGKPLAGRCGICGVVVPTPTLYQVDRYYAAAHREPDAVWVWGHFYLWDAAYTKTWKLESVRCDKHADHPLDPRRRF
jgi:hypothetical protein